PGIHPEIVNVPCDIGGAAASNRRSHIKEALMLRPFALFLLVTLGGASAAHAQMSLDADVCYVQYSVTIKVDHTTAGKALQDGRTIVTKYESNWENMVKLDLRSPGQVLSMVTGNQFDPAKMAKMTPAEQMKMSQ